MGLSSERRAPQGAGAWCVVLYPLKSAKVGLAVHRWYVLLFLVILLAIQTRNALRERKVLQEKFGERYEMYRHATWF
jgi:protein-S-isoprenylcysteine O-methyltransferase Ste14